MAGSIEGVDRGQSTLFRRGWRTGSARITWSGLSTFFVEELDLSGLGFARTTPARTGRPGYHPALLLKLFIYGYLNHVPSSRRLEREAGRNVEVMWLTGRLASDHKTIADFRRDNGRAIRKTCAQFVELCRRIGVLKGDCVAIDGSKFKAVNNRDLELHEGTPSAASTRWCGSTGRRKARRDRSRWPISCADMAASGRRSIA